jgi:3,4-dihydroxy 2-butanone 4-phosphate synthase/GTP cyclohydrolase II
VTTGISASDRAHTIRLLADPSSVPPTSPAGPRRPAARQGRRRAAPPGHTEAAVDLAVLAGLQPAGVLCEIVSEKDVEAAMARCRRAAGVRRRARTSR